MMLRALIILLFLCSAASAQTCGPDAVPAPAAAHGLTCEVFWDDFTSSSTVDLANTGLPGFKWYLQRTGTSVPTNPADIQFVAGGMKITPSSQTTNDLWNVTSCFATDGIGGYVGNAVQGSMYVDITITSLSDPGGTLWWPVLWALGFRQLGGGTPPGGYPFASPEIDFMEHTGGGRNLHQWEIFGGGSQTDTFVEYGGFVPGSLNPDEKIGALILAPEINGGTGTVVGYVNEVADAHVPATWSPGGTYSATTTTPICFLFTTGYLQPLVLRAFKVFVPPPSAGASRPRRGLH
jgi:hypothetical protein